MSENLEYEKPKYARYTKPKLNGNFGKPKPAPKPSATKKKRGRPSKEDKDD